MSIGRFNSRSREGSDFLTSSNSPLNESFNSRSREGSDGERLPEFMRHQVVSIHAPARGATRRVRFCIFSRAFQFTLPRGERQRKTASILSNGNVSIHAPARGATCSAWSYAMTSRFQFTLPRGERRIALTWSNGIGRFNSRSREGSDSGSNYLRDVYTSFNSRSREGSDVIAKLHSE